MNSVTSQRPLHHTVGYDSVPPFPLFRTALAPIASHSRFVCAGFLFSEWAIVSRAGFSLKGETDGIQTTVLSTYLLYSNTLIRLGHSFGLVVVHHFVVI